MSRWAYFIAAFVVVSMSGCAHIRYGPTPDGMVLLSISRSEITRLGSQLGMTPAFSYGPGRDAKGDELLFTLYSKYGQDETLVTVNADGVRTWPAHISQITNILVDQRVNLQEPPTIGWETSAIEGLASNIYIESVSGDWAVFREHNRLPWLAKIEAPTVRLLELPESSSEISIWSEGQIVHLFTRACLQYEECPLVYRKYDFEDGAAKLVKKLDMPWAKRPEDMDPKAGLVVLVSNSRSWARLWLLNLKTGRTRFLRVWPSTADFVFVKKETAQEWLKLARP
jgi:hypothetical protein